MKRIAILRCMRSNENCAGAACLRAFNQKRGFFARYGGEETELVAFWSCNGCEGLAFSDEAGLREKIDRIERIGTDVVHIGICCSTRSPSPGKLCDRIAAIAAELKRRNIELVFGTHG